MAIGDHVTLSCVTRDPGAANHAQTCRLRSRQIDPGWSEVQSSMERMHTAMAFIEASGNSDVDFVKLMIPHHEAAIDMARTQLLFGSQRSIR